MPSVGPQLPSGSGAAPAATGLMPALSEASSTTPAKPIASPAMRDPAGRSLSQAQATSAPNSGTVAFRMADRPVVRYSSAKAKQANGRPEFSTPTKNTDFQWRRSCGPWP